MEGIIFFADDNVFDNPFENGLFKALYEEGKHPVLPIVNLDLLETSIKSSSAVSALIVDWNFKRKGEGDIVLPDETPFNILNQSELFSLIYVYSESEGIEESEDGVKLREKFGDKIRFRKKDKNTDNVYKEKDQILQDLVKMHEDNPLKLPLKWAQVINQSVQKIFSELFSIDRNWVSDLYKTAEKDGVEPSIEVINLFQNLLSERVIQYKSLREEIANEKTEEDLIEPDQYAKLFRTFLYGCIEKDDPIMTGDIFDLKNGHFGILITPECDIRQVLSKKDAMFFEFLLFEKDSFKKDEFLLKVNLKKAVLNEQVEKIIDRKLVLAEKQQINTAFDEIESIFLMQLFNQPHQRIYVLPAFEFEKDNYNSSALIDYRYSPATILANEINPDDRICKLNSPYIQDVRQRFHSYKGRIGVPSFPDKIRNWLLNN